MQDDLAVVGERIESAEGPREQDVRFQHTLGTMERDMEVMKKRIQSAMAAAVAGGDAAGLAGQRRAVRATHLTVGMEAHF